MGVKGEEDEGRKGNIMGKHVKNKKDPSFLKNAETSSPMGKHLENKKDSGFKSFAETSSQIEVSRG